MTTDESPMEEALGVHSGWRAGQQADRSGEFSVTSTS